MLGATLVKNYQLKYDVYATSRADFIGNLSRKFMEFDLLENSYENLLEWSKPDIILHCAAVTDLDYAENNVDTTMDINAKSVKKFTSYNKTIKLIFISSDAVFPSQLNMAIESDSTKPETIYGRSKEMAEKYILNAGDPHLAIRTTIIGVNINKQKEGFVEWIINSIKNKNKITLFHDVIFTPISIWELSDELEWIIESKLSGLLHISSNKAITKYDLGLKICNKLGLDCSLIQKGSIDDFFFKAKRSKNQTLNSNYYFSKSNREVIKIDDTINCIIKHLI